MVYLVSCVSVRWRLYTISHHVSDPPKRFPPPGALFLPWDLSVVSVSCRRSSWLFTFVAGNNLE